MSSAPPAALLAAAHVTRRFGGFTAVDGVSVRVDPGEIVGLLGANGAGKTTLIRMVLGLLAPSDGHVQMFGALPSRQSRRRLGYVSQGLGLYLDMTVAENVSFNSAAFGVSADRIVLTDELQDMADRLVGSIGLGRQRQLAFACALGHRPELVVLDEPTSGVDPLARARLWDAIRAEAHRGVGVLVTTHYMEEAQQCDRLVLMASGKIAAEGTVADIVDGRTVVEVLAVSWSEAFAALSQAGHDVMLAGRRIRVASADVSEVDRALRRAGIVAELTVVPAVLDEAMVAVSSSR
jgi:ABC-2 type transport system ATP-binding protein/ribosome-dependent ATPase